MSEKRKVVNEAIADWGEALMASRGSGAIRGLVQAIQDRHKALDAALDDLIADERRKAVAEFAEVVREIADFNHPAFIRVASDWWEKLLRESGGGTDAAGRG